MDRFLEGGSWGLTREGIKERRKGKRQFVQASVLVTSAVQCSGENVPLHSIWAWDSHNRVEVDPHPFWARTVGYTAFVMYAVGEGQCWEFR
jgi:hypothetical protein